MAPSQMKMPEKKKIENVETDAVEYFSQRKRPEVGRFLLQVDRQTKRSYQNLETAESAALNIKKSYPLLHVAVYDTVEFATSVIAASAPSK
jgi:hypothetical protein